MSRRNRLRRKNKRGSGTRREDSAVPPQRFCRNPAVRCAPEVCELEPRVMFSGVPLDLPDAVIAAPEAGVDGSDLIVDSLFNGSFAENVASDWTCLVGQSDAPHDKLLVADDYGLESSSAILSTLSADMPSPADVSEIVFIDQGVDHWESLAEQIRTDHALLIEIDSGVDGISQISHSLQKFSNISAIHLVSHGAAGEIVLGNSVLSLDTLNARSAEIAQWNLSLSDGADLLIYGCDVAASPAGRTLTESLAALCNCDVATSDDVTGHADLGGDWDLEYQVGQLQSQIVPGLAIQQNWMGTLDISSNQVVHLQFDEAAGNAASDNSGNGNDGALTGTQDWVTGTIGGGFHFDYSDGADFFEIANASTVQDVQEGSFTLAAWFVADDVPSGSVSPDNDHSYGIIAKEGNHTGIWYRADQRFVFEHWLGGGSFTGVTSTGTYAPGTWHHIAIAVDRPAGAIAMYIDGALESTSSFTPGAASGEYNSETWKIGSVRDTFTPGTYAYPASGSIDDVRIFSCSLSAGDVAELNALGTLIVDQALDVVDGNTSSIAALLGDKGADGLVSLREAIQAANATPNGAEPDRIVFDFADGSVGHLYYQDDGLAGSLDPARVTAVPAGGEALITDFDPDHPHTWFRIDLDNLLPGLVVTDTLVIDGYSQPGASPNTLTMGNDAIVKIEVTNSAGDGNSGLSFNTGANGSILQGLVINDFGSMGVLVNYDVDDITIQGNFIGTDVSGTLDRGNGDAGIQVRSDNNRIGGSTAADRNIISGSNNRGIAFFSFSTISGNVVENNYIGVDASGLTALGNRGTGIQLYDTDGTRIIDNVISGNEDEGILFRSGSEVRNSQIQGNRVGVGADGTTGIGNGLSGIRIAADIATDNLIGGDLPGQGNIISGNGENGVMLDGAGLTGTLILGNWIGTDVSGSLNLGNRIHGIRIENGASSSRIGGLALTDRNVIAFNDADGVSLKDDAGNGNAILGNSIYSNADLGIDLNDDDETLNDIDDSDGGANTLINFPVLTNVVTDGTSVSVSGWFKTRPGLASYRLEFFISNLPDASGYGEGQSFIGFVDVATDSSGLAFFSQTFVRNVAPGRVITATATDSLNNTSEFSLARRAAVDTLTRDGIWMSTTGDVTGSGAPGLDSWSQAEVLGFGGPGLQLEPPTTAGEFGSVLNLNLLSDDGDVDIDGIHYVTQAVTIGAGANAIDLVAGDLLISTGSDESFLGGTFTAGRDDLFLFRPLVAGDYSVGRMQLVLDMDSPSLSLPAPDPDLNFNNMWSVTLVEQDVTLGGYDLFAGEILFSREGGSEDDDIYVFHVSDAGAGVTDGTADKLIEGSAWGFNGRILGLDIIERTIVVGGQTLAQASLLVTTDNNTTILDSDADLLNDLTVQRYDIVSLNVSQTELNGGTVVDSAAIVFEGADVSLNAGNENIDAFSIVGDTSGNSQPTDISPDSFSLAENTFTGGGISLGTLAAADPDGGETFTWSIVGGADGAAFWLAGAGNELFFDESLIDDGWLDFEDRASYSVDIEVRDSGGNTRVETIVLNVNDLNEDPVVVAAVTATATEDDPPLSVDLLAGASDPDTGDTLGIAGLTLVSGDARGVTVAGTLLNVDPSAYNDLAVGQTEVITCSYSIVDGNGGLVSQMATITISGLNDSPRLGNNQLTIAEGATVTLSSVNLSGTDVDDADSGLVFNVSNVAGGQFELAAMPGLAVNSFTQAQLAAGDIVFVDDGDDVPPGYDVAVTDGLATDGPFPATIIFFSSNDNPTTSGIPGLTVDEDAPDYSLNLYPVFADSEDADSALAYSITGNTNPGLFDAVNIAPGGNLQLDFADNLHGSATITVTATDTGGLSVSATFLVTVNPVNDQPIVTSPVGAVSVDEDSGDSVIDLVTVFDDVDIITDGDSLTISVVSNSNTGLVSTNLVNGQLTLDYRSQQFGLATIVVRATDLAGEYRDETILVNVAPVNDAPLVNDQTITMIDGTAAVGNVLAGASDIEGDGLTVSLLSGPTSGSLVLNADGTFVYLPDPGFTGTASFTFVASDGTDTSNIGTISIEFGGPLDPVLPVPATDTPEPPASDPDDELPAPVTLNTPVSGPEPRPPAEPNFTLPEQPVFGTSDELVTGQVLRPVTHNAEYLSFQLLTPDFQERSLPTIEIPAARMSGAFLASLERFGAQMDDAASKANMVFVTTVVSMSGLSIGAVSWILRSGALVTSLMAQMPAWKLIDPLIVLGYFRDEEDDESIQDIIDSGTANPPGNSALPTGENQGTLPPFHDRGSHE